MHTNSDKVSGGRRRRTHSDEFRAQIVTACRMPGVSTAEVAMAHGINANLPGAGSSRPRDALSYAEQHAKTLHCLRDRHRQRAELARDTQRCS